jgi:hypothetical protein
MSESSPWVRVSDPNAAHLFDRLVGAVQPFVDAAAPSAPSDVARLFARLYPGDPVVVEIVCESANGKLTKFQATDFGDFDAAKIALGEFVTAGLNRLPALERERVGNELVEAGGELRLDLDATFGGSLFFMRPGYPDRLLVQFHGGDVQ